MASWWGRSAVQSYDLLSDQEDQETRWAREIQECQIRFEQQVLDALKFSRNKANRMKYYTQLRKDIGDDAAREVAKMVEGILAGKCRYPKWFRKTGNVVF